MQTWKWMRAHLSARQIIFAALVAIFLPAKTIFGLNIERWAEKHQFDSVLAKNETAVMGVLTWLADFLVSDIFVGFAVGGLVVSFWGTLSAWVLGHGKKGRPEGAQTIDPTKIEDPEIVELLSDVRRLVGMLGDFGDPANQRANIALLMNRIELSDHAIWLDDVNSQLRTGILHWAGIAQHDREQHGPVFRNEDIRDQVLGELAGASQSLQKRLVAQSSK